MEVGTEGQLQRRAAGLAAQRQLVLLEPHRRAIPDTGATAWPAIRPRRGGRAPSPAADGAGCTDGACGARHQRSRPRAAPHVRIGGFPRRRRSAHGQGAAGARRRSTAHGTAIHLHDEGPAQGHAAGQGDPQGHLALVLPDGQDRRPRGQRRRQEHAAAHHGRRRQGLRRARPSPPTGTRIGFLPQEPQLDAKKKVLEIVEEAVARSGRSSRSTRTSPRTGPTRTRTSWAASRTRSTPRTSGSWTGTSRWRWTRCACRRATPR